MQINTNSKKIAIIADWLTNRGGAENVIIALIKIFPKATVFTSVYSSEFFPELKNKKVKTSFLQKLPKNLRKKHQFLLPFLPLSFEKLNLKNFDLIISSSSAFSKCIKKTNPKQIHICYCHSPTRYLFHAKNEYLKEYPLPWFLRPFKFTLPILLNWLKKKDLNSIKQIDHFIANSKFIAQRIKKYYNRKATIIHPCINPDPFLKASQKFKKQNYFLAVGRFIPYKKFDLIIKAFIKNKLPIKLAGIGPELQKCKNIVNKNNAKNIEFINFISNKKLPELYAKAQAFIFPIIEDFGLTPVESMCSGTPIIFLNQGGAKESIDENSGIPFKSQSPEKLNQAIQKFIKTKKKFIKTKIKNQGQKFSEKNFKKNLLKFIKRI